jgi:hypothetical protein
MNHEQQIADWLLSAYPHLLESAAALEHDIGDDGHDYGVIYEELRRLSASLRRDALRQLPEISCPFDSIVNDAMKRIDWNEVAGIVVTKSEEAADK